MTLRAVLGNRETQLSQIQLCKITIREAIKICRDSILKNTEGGDIRTSQYSYLVVLSLNWVPDNWVYRLPSFFLLLTPNMTGRRFHRTTEVMQRCPWKSKSPLLPDLLNEAYTTGRGARTRYDAVLPPFISIVRCPPSSSHPVPDFRMQNVWGQVC